MTFISSTWTALSTNATVSVVSVTTLSMVQPTEEKHDQHLRHFLHIAMKEGLRFNSSKCVIKVQQISFFGILYTSHDLLPDPKKIEDITQMPVPQDTPDLQRFLGMVNFIAPHLPNLSQLTAPLRDLLKKTNIWSGTLTTSPSSRRRSNLLVLTYANSTTTQQPISS